MSGNTLFPLSIWSSGQDIPFVELSRNTDYGRAERFLPTISPIDFSNDDHMQCKFNVNLLVAQTDHLRTQNEEYSEKLQKIKKENEKVVDELKQKLNEKEATVEQLDEYFEMKTVNVNKMKLTKLEIENKKLKKDYDDLKLKMEKERDESVQKDKEIQKLKEQLHQAKDQKEVYCKAMRTSLADKDILEFECKNAQMDLAELREEHVELTKKCYEYFNSLIATQETVETLREKLDYYKQMNLDAFPPKPESPCKNFEIKMLRDTLIEKNGELTHAKNCLWESLQNNEIPAMMDNSAETMIDEYLKADFDRRVEILGWRKRVKNCEDKEENVKMLKRLLIRLKMNNDELMQEKLPKKEEEFSDEEESEEDFQRRKSRLMKKFGKLANKTSEKKEEESSNKEEIERRRMILRKKVDDRISEELAKKKEEEKNSEKEEEGSSDESDEEESSVSEESSSSSEEDTSENDVLFFD